MLITIPEILTREEVNHFREQIARAGWQDGRKTAGTLARHVKKNRQLEDGSDVAVKLGNQILRALANNPLFISAALPNRIYPPKFNCYGAGEKYGAHIDSSLMLVPGTAVTVRTDLSATLFISNPEEYEGGELVIEDNYGRHNVKLPAGDMVLYPSTSLHEVTTVTSGERVASFFWIQSMIRENQQRELLFSLDQSVQRLTLTLGSENEEVICLSGLYHNLVRGWAQT
jgi:PKHD-type hydroxylase